MDKRKSAVKEDKYKSPFYLQLKESSKVKDIVITNNDSNDAIKAIGGTFKLYDDYASFFYGESISFLSINIRAIYRIEIDKNKDESDILKSLNKYNEYNFGTKACLLSFDESSFEVELNVEAMLNPGSSDNLPIEPMLMILARSKSEIDIYIESHLNKLNGEV